MSAGLVSRVSKLTLADSCRIFTAPRPVSATTVTPRCAGVLAQPCRHCTLVDVRQPDVAEHDVELQRPRSGRMKSVSARRHSRARQNIAIGLSEKAAPTFQLLPHGTAELAVLMAPMAGAGVRHQRVRTPRVQVARVLVVLPAPALHVPSVSNPGKAGASPEEYTAHPVWP